MKKKLFYMGCFFVLSYITVSLIIHSYFIFTTPIEHKNWIEEKGWHIAYFLPKKEEFIVPKNPESLQIYTIADVHFNGYKHKKITQYRYRLKETCNHEYLEAVILSSEGKMFESYMHVSNSTPGVIEMLDHEVYMDEICLY